MTPAQKCNSWSLNFVLKWGQGKEKGRKMVVFFKCEGSSKLFRASELLLACAGRHMEMLSVEAEKEKTKTGPWIEKVMQGSGEA